MIVAYMNYELFELYIFFTITNIKRHYLQYGGYYHIYDNKLANKYIFSLSLFLLH